MAKIKLKRLNSSSSDDSLNDKKEKRVKKKRKNLVHNLKPFHFPLHQEIVDCSFEKKININPLMEELKLLNKTLSTYKTNNQLLAKENERLKQLNRYYQYEISQLKMNLDHQKALLDEYKKKMDDSFDDLVLAINKDAEATTVEDGKQFCNEINASQLNEDMTNLCIQSTKITTGAVTRVVKTNPIRKYLNKRDNLLKAVDEFEEPIQKTGLNEEISLNNSVSDDDRTNLVDFDNNSNQNYAQQQQQQQSKFDVANISNSKSKNLRSPLSTLVNRPLMDRSPLIRTCDHLDTEDDNKENQLKRRKAPVSYKEPNLKCKVRRDKSNQTVYVLKPNPNKSK